MYKNLHIPLLMLAAAAMIIAGCKKKEYSRDEDVAFPEVNFFSNSDTWSQNDCIGIYMVETGTQTVVDNAANRRYVTAAGDGRFSPASEEQTICFPLDANDKVDFIAYCPQAALTGNTYAVDVTDQSSPAAIDLLWSNNATALDKTVQTVDLKFYHRLSRIEVELKAGAGVSEAELAGTTVTLSNQPVKADFDVLQNTMATAADVAEITLLTGTNGLSSSAIILPQEGIDGRTLHFSFPDGTEKSGQVEGARTFEQGKKTIFNITVKRDFVGGIEVEVTATIEPWEVTVGEANGDYYLSGQSGFRHYFVGTEAGLKAWAEYVNAGNLSSNCTLKKDINLTINADDSNNWLPLGNRSNPYIGTFDGAGYEIDNIIFRLGADDSAYDVGFFSCSAGIIQNLTIGENSIFESEKGMNVGSIVGRMASSDNHGQIINCHSKATLKSTRNIAIGGIVGAASTYQNYSHLLIGCSFSGNITTPYEAGGIVGDVSNNQDVDHGNDLLFHFYMVGCYSTGKINVQSGSEADAVGGIVGSSTCYGYGRVAYLGCYSTAEGLSDLSASNVGGLIGNKYTQKEGTQHYLSSCYWSNYTGNSVGQGSSADQNTAFVDGENINWATATANMNAAIKEWNAARDNLCQYHYEQKNGTNNPPTLVEGAPN